MTANCSFSIFGGRRFRPSVGLLCLPLWLAAFVNTARTEEQQPEATISRLEFRVVDVRPADRPVTSFRYDVELYSANEKEPDQRLGVDYRSDDGILRIPKPYPPFGRIRVWVHLDDLDKGYRLGYCSFSFRIDELKPAEPPTIRLELGVVLTGKVLDAETGKPIAGAEVAPLKRGHHASWADWKHSTKTDPEGEYRIATGVAEGIAVQHPNYGGAKLDYRHRGFVPGHNQRAASWSGDEDKEEPKVGPDGFVFRLQTLMAVRGRVVDAEGKPIAGVSPYGYRADPSDAEGRFCLRVTRDEWAQRENERVRFDTSNYRTLNVPLQDFALDRETVVTLHRKRQIQGQIFDEAGKPLEDCEVELKCEQDAAMFDPSFCVVPGPYPQGRWSKHIDESDRVFTLRVSAAGFVRSVKRYTLEEVIRGPIITRLHRGRRLSGNFVARVPLDENNTPAIFLGSSEDKDFLQQARVEIGDGFAFSGLADGQYTLRLHPALSPRCAGGLRSPDAGGFVPFRSDSPNKPWETSIAIQGRDVQLEPIDLHKAGLLPGRVTGLAFHPDAGHKPFANAFGYISKGANDRNSVGHFHYLLSFMTDSEGRFHLDCCPPGKYVLRLTEQAAGYRAADASVWIRVTPEQTSDLRLFAPETDYQMAINFVVGDGSSRDVHAAAGLDPKVIAKYVDPKTGQLPYIEDVGEQLRAVPSTIRCELEPLGETFTHWPVYAESSELSPRNLLKDNLRHIVIPNVSPGRWRLTLSATSDLSFEERLSVRDVVFTKGLPPLQIALPPAALAGTFHNPNPGWHYTTIEAVPRQPGLPTRTCEVEGFAGFRFLGVAPGEYSVLVKVKGCEIRRVDNVVVHEGQTTWLENIALKSTIPKKETAPPKTPPDDVSEEQLRVLSLDDTAATDARLERLKAPTKIGAVSLRNSEVTDAGLEHLKGLTQLRELCLDGTRVTDASLKHLAGLTRLESLSLCGTQVSDAGLEHLKGLLQLRRLWLNGTQVTDAGLVCLKGITQLEQLLLDGTRVTDAGLECLKGMSQLRLLRVCKTQVTNDGVKKVQQLLPDCSIIHH